MGKCAIPLIILRFSLMLILCFVVALAALDAFLVYYVRDITVARLRVFLILRLGCLAAWALYGASVDDLVDFADSAPALVDLLLRLLLLLWWPLGLLPASFALPLRQDACSLFACHRASS